LRIDISATDPFSERALAHEKSDAGDIRGKVLLVP